MRYRLALGLAAVMLLAACGGGGTAGDDGVAETVASSAATSVASTTTVAEAPSANATVAPLGQAAFVADATVLDRQFAAVPEGTYLSEELGIPFSFEIVGDWWVQPNSLGHVVFTHPDSIGPGDRDVVFIRPIELVDPVAPNVNDDMEPWPVDDIEGWIDNVFDGFAVSNVADADVGGLEAVRFDVELVGLEPCGPEFCAGFVKPNETTGFTFEPGFTYRVYWVDAGDEPPVTIIIGTLEEDLTWRETGEGLLATVAFSEPGPHPAPSSVDPWTLGLPGDVPAGVASFPVAGGLSLELDTTRFVFQNDGFMVVTLEAPGAVLFFPPMFDNAFTELATVDEVADALQTGSYDITETEFDLDGFEGRAFDVRESAGDGNFTVRWKANNTDSGWEGAPWARVWVLDTERGPLMISAESYESESFMDDAVELAKVLVATLEFVELG